jgi:hypothetical protein
MVIAELIADCLSMRSHCWLFSGQPDYNVVLQIMTDGEAMVASSD